MTICNTIMFDIGNMKSGTVFCTANCLDDDAEIEASYRDMSLPTDTFLSDTIQASFLISQLDFHGSIKNVYTRELRDGIRRIKAL